MYYGAIDLHKNNSVLGIIDADGQRLYMRKIPNDLDLIKKALGPFAEKLEGIHTYQKIFLSFVVTAYH